MTSFMGSHRSLAALGMTPSVATTPSVRTPTVSSRAKRGIYPASSFRRQLFLLAGRVVELAALQPVARVLQDLLRFGEAGLEGVDRRIMPVAEHRRDVAVGRHGKVLPRRRDHQPA